MQDFDQLRKGSPGSGGSMAGTGAAGFGSQSSLVGGGSGSPDTVIAGGVSEAGATGLPITRGGAAGDAGDGGGIGAQAGQPLGVSGSPTPAGAGGKGSSGAGNGGAIGHATCPAGAAGCAVPTCAPGFVDCNGDMAADGCETYLNALTNCGTTCTNVVACNPNQVCNAGACGAPQGLVTFSVPLTAASQAQRYAYKFASVTNLKNTIIFVRLYAPGGQQGIVNIYPIDADYTFSTGIEVNLSSIAEGWLDASIAIGDVSGAFDPGLMYQLTLEVHAGSAGPWTNPTVVYVDSIWSSNGAVNETFKSSFGGMVESSLLRVDGSVLSWTDTVN